MARISVIGAGYVGLCTAVTFAHLGSDVIGVDVDAARVARLRGGACPIFEPGLDELLQEAIAARRLTFTDDYTEAIPGADFIFICVNTPPAPNGGADMRFVQQAVRSISHTLTPGHRTIIVDKSTMPVGSGDMVAQIIDEHAPIGAWFAVVSNPEFLREGAAVHDMLHPDRIVLGSHDRSAAEAVAALYASFDAPCLITDLRTAEMIKYASNAFLATRISFINEIARICEGMGADVRKVATGMGLDRRIGPHFLNAGIGFGGSCFPKDVQALAFMAGQSGYHPLLLNAVLAINRESRRAVIRKLNQLLGTVQGATIAIWGLAFKPETDDLRDAPSLEIIQELQAHGAVVRAYDPVAMENARALLPDVTMSMDAYAAAEGADAVVCVTEWAEFKAIDFKHLQAIMRRPVLVDGRNLYDAEEIRAFGIVYDGVGLPSADMTTGTLTHMHTRMIPLIEQEEEALRERAASRMIAD